MIWSLYYISFNLGSWVLGLGSRVFGPGLGSKVVANEYAIFLFIF